MSTDVRTSPTNVAPPDEAERVVVVLQPSYLPWLGYYAQMVRSDVFVLYDDVQYDKHGWRNRNRIKTPNGPQWLTVPVRTTGREKPLLRDVEIETKQPWRRKHLQAIRQNYAKAPFLKEYLPRLEALYETNWERLVDLNAAALRTTCEMLGLDREILFSSEMGIEGDRIQRLIDICHVLGGTTFYEGAAGRDYIDDSAFTDAGLSIEYQEYDHPSYTQLHGDFVGHLSVVDLLLHHGPESLEILTP